MSSERKTMKITAMLMFVWAVVVLVFDVIAIVLGANDGWNAGEIVYVVLDAAAGLFAVWLFIQGVKGANTPSKSGPFVKGSIIMCVYLAAYVVFSLFIGGVSPTSSTVVFATLGLVISLVGWLYGKKVLEASLNK